MNFTCSSALDMSPELYQALSVYRRKVFVNRLGWSLPSGTAETEQDQFDHNGTVYLVAQDEVEDVVGCGRLLPSTGSYLLQEVFPQLFNGIEPPRSPNVWELSRFAAGAQGSAGATTARQDHLAERLLLRALQYCERKGVEQLLAVTTVAVERLMLRAGVDLQRLGPPSIIDGQPVLAFVIWVNERSIVSLSTFDEPELRPSMSAGSRLSRPTSAWISGSA